MKHPLCIFVKEKDQGWSRTYDVIKCAADDGVCSTILVSATWRVSTYCNLGVLCDLTPEMTTSDLGYCHLTLKKIFQGLLTWLTLYWPLVTKFAFYEVSWVPKTEYMNIFYMDLFIVPLGPFRRQSGPDTVCHQTIFSGGGDVAAFRDAMLNNHSTKMP